VLDPAPALVRDQRQQAAGRHGEQVRVRVILAGEHGHEPDRRQQHVDEVDDAEHRRQLARRDAGPEPLAQRRGDEVGAELGKQCEDVDAGVLPARRPRVEQREHQRGPDRVPAAGEREQRAFGMHAAEDDLRQHAEQRPGRDERRDRLRRQQEQHRHEHELRRAHLAGAEKETHSVHHRVGDGEKHRREGLVPVARGGQHDPGNHHEQRCSDDLDPSLLRCQPPASRNVALEGRRLRQVVRGHSGSITPQRLDACSSYEQRETGNPAGPWSPSSGASA
jgi:hypothetical protein